LRRLCFDTENSYFKSGIGIASAETHRTLIQERHALRPIRLKCAVVYDEVEGHFHEFHPHQLEALVDCLLSADLLISHSGTRHDLPILECLAGEERTAPLFRLPHHDLLDELPWASVENHARHYVPVLWEQYAAEYDERRASVIAADKSGKENSLTNGSYLLLELAKATFDVKCTYAVYEATLAR